MQIKDNNSTLYAAYETEIKTFHQYVEKNFILQYSGYLSRF